MDNCKFLDQYQIETYTDGKPQYVTFERCKLGYDVPLSGCIGPDCPDYEPVIPNSHKPPIPKKV